MTAGSRNLRPIMCIGEHLGVRGCQAQANDGGHACLVQLHYLDKVTIFCIRTWQGIRHRLVPGKDESMSCQNTQVVEMVGLGLDHTFNVRQICHRGG